MRYFLSILLLLISMLVTNCDTDSISSSYSRPEIRLVVIEDESTLEGASIGDTVTLALGLDLKNMSDIFSLGFKISFDEQIFQPRYEDLNLDGLLCSEIDESAEESIFEGCGIYNDEDLNNSYDYNISSSFFETSGEPIYDNNQNGTLDEDESFVDQNGNGEYDPPIEYPEGNIMVGDEDGNDSLDYFEGNLGVPDPNRNGNVWGSGRACKFYFTGVLTETVFNIEITNAETYIGGTEQFENYSTSSWDIYTLLVGTPHDPILSLEQGTNPADNQILVRLKIEDSPKLASFTSEITYNPDVLTWLSANQLSFFNSNHYIDYNPTIDMTEGEFLTEFNHNILSGSADLEAEPLAEGWGDIIEITFLVNDGVSDSTATINITNNSILPLVIGYNQNTSSTYELDKSYWTIEETLEVNF